MDERHTEGRREEGRADLGRGAQRDPAVRDREAPDARVYPNGYACIQRDVEALGRIIGTPVSCHDLRRSFGRNLYKRGVDVNRIRALYNHATSEMTLYYIGETLDGMREAVELFDLPRPPPAAPILGV